MEAEARKRKERLAALRAAKESADAAAAAAAAGDAEPAVDAAAEGGNNRKRPHEDDGAESEGDGSTAGTTCAGAVPGRRLRLYTLTAPRLRVSPDDARPGRTSSSATTRRRTSSSSRSWSPSPSCRRSRRR